MEIIDKSLVQEPICCKWLDKFTREITKDVLFRLSL